MFKKSALNFIQNQLIIFPCLAYFNKPSYKFEGFPTMTEVIPQFVLIYFVEDFFTYWSHRTLHHPKLYKFHKLHHEYDKVYSLAF
jgi:sterol desaturase/sphingolipid hydroxylase (fatty acid hydroxylase superfamily)